MDWCRLTTDYYRDPALIRAGEDAEVLFLRCIAYSGEQESRGRVPLAMLPMLCPTRTKARTAALLEESLVFLDGKDVVIRSWERHQEALDTEAQRRRKWREKKQRQRADAANQTSEGGHVPGTVPGTEGDLSGGRPRLIEVEVEKERTNTSPPVRRIDVEQVCTAMADASERITSRRPNITDTWRKDARLLLDHDGRSLADVLAVIRWVEQDTFWRTNVLGVPKLRKQFDQLYAKARPSKGARAAGDNREYLDMW